MADWIGRSLSKVTIQKLLGRGGMADVYGGVHDTLNRQVAIKILHGHLLEDDELMVRFRSEAQAVANLRHPNIVQVYDFDLVDDQPYIVMEMLDGPSLAEYLGHLRRADQVLLPQSIERIVSAVASALDYAHLRGIVHRDVKPSNVILRRDGGHLEPGASLPGDVEPILTDFGVARISNTTIRTASGAIVGTPAYMSPEQVSGETVDSRSDVYSLGIMCYEMIAMRLPFTAESDTVAATLIKHITEPPPPLVEAPRSVQDVVMRALAKDRAARYQSAGELAFDLKEAFGLPISDAERQAHLEKAATIRMPATPVPSSAGRVRMPPPAAPSRRGVILVTLAFAALISLAALLLVFLTGNGDAGNRTTANTPAPPPADAVFGMLRFSDAAASLDRVTAEVINLAPPPEGSQYEMWLMGIESRVPMGKLTLDDDGHGDLVYIDEDGDNLLADFGRFEITVEPDPDPNPLPTGDVAYSGAVPNGPLMHVRHLLSEFGRAPDGSGLAIGLVRDANLLQSLADDLAAAFAADDLAAVRRSAEGIVNLIEGSGGEHHGDLDGDGDPYEPGDGFGLLPGMQGSGYIQSAIEHARYAAGTEDATAYIIAQAGEFESAAQNLGGWAAQIRDAALALLERDTDTAPITETDVQQIVDLVDMFINGQDANGDGVIEAAANEGGVRVVYDHALRMADMAVLAGRGRTPDPVSVNPNPNILPEPGY